MIQLDIVLNFGFRTINYKCDFKYNKGFKLFESDRLYTVSEIIQPNVYCAISAMLLGKSVSLPLYKVRSVK